MSLLFSIIESPYFPDISPFYKSVGIEEVKLTSQRKAISQLKRQTPDIVVAEFFYGYGNNYAGINVSNLDVLLHSMRKYAPEARVIIFATPREMPHTPKLTKLFDIHAVLPLPLNKKQFLDAIQNVKK